MKTTYADDGRYVRITFTPETPDDSDDLCRAFTRRRLPDGSTVLEVTAHGRVESVPVLPREVRPREEG